MSAKIIYKDIAPGSDADATVSSPQADGRSDISKLPFGIANPDIGTMEHNHWGLGGEEDLYDDQIFAFLSAEMSEADCSFETPPTITVAFDGSYTTLGVFLRFSLTANDYATSVTLTWYHDDTQLDQMTFYPDGTSYFCEHTVEVYNKITIAINATNLPYRYARLEQILFGLIREFDGHEIGSVDILQQSSLISAELTVNTLDWKLKSKGGVDYIFQLKQPVLAYNGSNLIGVFYIDDNAKRTDENTYEIPCSDAIGVLDDDNFSAAVYTDKNAAELMTEIVDGAFELDIDPAFSMATVTGYIPDCTRREALQQVAFVIGAIVSTAGTDKIKVFPIPSDSLREIPPSLVYVGGSVSQDSVVTAVVVTHHTYAAGSGSSGDDVVTVNGVKYVHTTGTVRVDNPNVTATDKQNVKTVKDATLVNASNVAAVANRVYAYYQRRNTVNTKIVVTDETPGSQVSVPTAWGDTKTGNIESMKIKLSNTTAADITIKAVTQ